jgi:hypothetical protein
MRLVFCEWVLRDTRPAVQRSGGGGRISVNKFEDEDEWDSGKMRGMRGELRELFFPHIHLCAKVM